MHLHAVNSSTCNMHVAYMAVLVCDLSKGYKSHHIIVTVLKNCKRSWLVRGIFCVQLISSFSEAIQLYGQVSSIAWFPCIFDSTFDLV